MENSNKDTKFPGWELSKRIQVIKIGEEQKVLLEGRPYMSWSYKDRVAQRVAIVQLYKSGLASREELAEAFNIHVNSVYNYTTRFEKDGIASLLDQESGPKDSWKITPEVKFMILEVAFNNTDISYEGIVDLVKRRWNREISISTIRSVLIENGFRNPVVKERPQEPLVDLFERKDKGQGHLWNSNEFEEIYVLQDLPEQADQNQIEQIKEDEEIFEGNLKNRRLSFYSPAERVYLNRLEKGVFSTYTGGLLFVPLLSQHNFIPIIKRIINIETYEGYTLEQLCAVENGTMGRFNSRRRKRRVVEMKKYVRSLKVILAVGLVLMSGLSTSRAEDGQKAISEDSSTWRIKLSFPIIFMSGFSDQHYNSSPEAAKIWDVFNVISGNTKNAVLVKRLRSQGKIFAYNVGFGPVYGVKTVDSWVKAWSEPFENTLAGELPGGFDAIAIDEIGDTDGSEASNTFIEAIKQLRAKYPDRLIFVWGGWRLGDGGPSSTYGPKGVYYDNELKALNEYADVSIIECYIHERNLQFYLFNDLASNMESRVPGILRKTIYGIDISQEWRGNSDDSPYIGFKGFLDEQLQVIRNTPITENVPGIAFWTFTYSRPETVVHLNNLIKHYFLERKSDYYGDGDYKNMVDNPSFETSDNSWALKSGSGCSIARSGYNNLNILAYHNTEYASHETQCLQMVKGSGYNQATQVISVKPGATYTVSAYVIGPSIGTKQSPVAAHGWDTQPLSEDANTLLLLHFDGEEGVVTSESTQIQGVAGEKGIVAGTPKIKEGKFGQAIETDKGDSLKYATSGNYSVHSGTVEMWVKTPQDFGKGSKGLFSEIYNSWDRNSLLFLFSDTTLYFYGYNRDMVSLSSSNSKARAWGPGEWHHIACTWKTTPEGEQNMHIYLDGDDSGTNMMATNAYTRYGSEVGTYMFIGGSDQFQFDEVRISDVQKTYTPIPSSKLLTGAELKVYDKRGESYFSQQARALDLNPNQWTRMSLTFTTPPDTANVVISLNDSPGEAGNVLFWDFIEMD